MEPMAFKTPVISTRYADIQNLVLAILVEKNDVDRLAEALEFMLDSTELRARQGARSRRTITNQYREANAELLTKRILGWMRNGSCR